MKVLVACEYSGIIRDAFLKLGHDAISCDLLPTDSLGPHYQGDVFDIINDGFDLMIAHPPCTYLTIAGNAWFAPKYANKYPTRQQDRLDAIEFVKKLYNAPIDKICIENPVGVLSTQFKKPTQNIQPYQFGHPISKRTCFWLKNLPPLIGTELVSVDWHTCKNGKRWSKWDWEICKRPPSERGKLRSKTFQGIADAMAAQWGV